MFIQGITIIEQLGQTTNFMAAWIHSNPNEQVDSCILHVPNEWIRTCAAMQGADIEVLTRSQTAR